MGRFSENGFPSNNYLEYYIKGGGAVMSNVSWLMCVRLTQGCPDNIFDIQLHHRTRGSVESMFTVHLFNQFSFHFNFFVHTAKWAWRKYTKKREIFIHKGCRFKSYCNSPAWNQQQRFHWSHRRQAEKNIFRMMVKVLINTLIKKSTALNFSPGCKRNHHIREVQTHNWSRFSIH